jgi:hypothetical protein
MLNVPDQREDQKMALRGSAFLALWNEVGATRQAEYDLWHTLEHVPQRVGVPGFISGHQYRTVHRRGLVTLTG